MGDSLVTSKHPGGPGCLTDGSAPPRSHLLQELPQQAGKETPSPDSVEAPSFLLPQSRWLCHLSPEYARVRPNLSPPPRRHLEMVESEVSTDPGVTMAECLSLERGKVQFSLRPGAGGILHPFLEIQLHFLLSIDSRHQLK